MKLHPVASAQGSILRPAVATSKQHWENINPIRYTIKVTDISKGKDQPNGLTLFHFGIHDQKLFTDRNWSAESSARKQSGVTDFLTEAIRLVTRTLHLIVHPVIEWTVNPTQMLVPDVLEIVYSVFWKHEADRHGMDRCVTPALKFKSGLEKWLHQSWRWISYLVIETSCPVKMFKVIHIGCTPIEVHVGDLEVTPDCINANLSDASQDWRVTHNGTYCMFSRHRQTDNPVDYRRLADLGISWSMLSRNGLKLQVLLWSARNRTLNIIP
jgi:hypothetical protein